MSLIRTAMVLVAACGLVHVASQSALAEGAVSGTVVFKGMPLAEGKVTLYQKNGQFAGSKVKDGKFAIDRFPAGIWKVSVEGKNVPAKYVSDDTTPLLITVKDGENSFVLTLD